MFRKDVTHSENDSDTDTVGFKEVIAEDKDEDKYSITTAYDPLPNTTIVLDIETAGLDAQGDHIVCIGILDPDRGIQQFTRTAKDFRTDPLQAEREILLDFLNYIACRKIALISYNGVNFDVPFILTRLEYHDIQHDIGFPPKSHIDLSRFVKHTTGRYTSKDTAARNTAGLYVPSNFQGSFIARIYKHKKVTDEQHMEMLQHNAIDLVATINMHSILKYYPDFDSWLLEESVPQTLAEKKKK